MAENTIKTDDRVHERLKELKREYGAETFNDVLRRELGLNPGTDLDKLAAFLNEELRDAVRDVVDEIESLGEFERGYEKEHEIDYLTFVAEDSGRKVADIEFRDGYFTVRYRDQNGKMRDCGKGTERYEGIEYGTTVDPNERYDVEDVLDSVREKVTKSFRRWNQE